MYIDHSMTPATAEAKVVDRYPQTDWPDSEFPSEISMV